MIKTKEYGKYKVSSKLTQSLMVKDGIAEESTSFIHVPTSSSSFFCPPASAITFFSPSQFLVQRVELLLVPDVLSNLSVCPHSSPSSAVPYFSTTSSTSRSADRTTFLMCDRAHKVNGWWQLHSAGRTTRCSALNLVMFVLNWRRLSDFKRHVALAFLLIVLYDFQPLNCSFAALDDPEGSFVPPEFDSAGSTFEVRVANRLKTQIKNYHI